MIMRQGRAPEDVLREFLIANLRPDEVRIRRLIVNHPEADILWQGDYPENVATLLEQQYRTMAIERIGEQQNQVLLRCSASPIPLEVVKIGDCWFVDAGPIIDARKRAEGRS